MRFLTITFLFAALVAVMVSQPVVAEIVYTQTNISIPVGGSYNIDLNQDGIADFTLKSKLIQAYCQSGDEYIWSLTVTPSNGTSVVVDANNIGSDYAAALPVGVPVNSSQYWFNLREPPDIRLTHLCNRYKVPHARCISP